MPQTKFCLEIYKPGGFFPVRLHKMLQRYLNLNDLILKVIHALVLMNIFPVPKITSNWEKNAGNSSVHCMFLCYCFSKYRYVPHSTLHMTVYCPMYFTLPEKRICGCLLYLKEITNPQVLLKYCKFHIPREPVKY